MDSRILENLGPVALALDLNRLADILKVLVKHGFSSIVTRIISSGKEFEGLAFLFKLSAVPTDSPSVTLPERIRLVLQDLGPTFIKLGQILSTRSDLIPDEFATELKKLQDDVPPFDRETAIGIVENELGKPVSSLFAEFESQHLATASIGQVYGARLHDGSEVVVKVQRPEISKTIHRDLHLLAEMAVRLERIWPHLSTYDLPGIVEQFDRALLRELDYAHERRSAQRFANAFKNQDRIIVPRVYPEHSSSRVLTMERIRGRKITQAAELGCDPHVLAEIAIEAVLTMVFEHGFFHADPHPGNIFALPGNRIAFLDLGMVGRLDDGLRFQLADLIIALVENNVESAARILRSIGRREAPIDRGRFLSDVGEIMDRVVGVPISEVQLSEVLRDLFDGARRHRIKVPADCFLMGKAMLTVETVARGLDPNLDIESAVTPHIRRLIAIRMAPKRLGRMVWQRLSETFHTAGELPDQLTDLLESLQRGSLTVRVEPVHQDRTMNTIERLVQKLTFALIISSLVLSSALFIIFSGFQGAIWGIPAPLFLGFGGYILAAVLGWTLFRQANKPRD